jgi:hypothetical protein
LRWFCVTCKKPICDVKAQTTQNNQASQNIVQKQIMKHIKFYYIIFVFWYNKMIRNEFISFVWSSYHPKKKMTETLHHALRAMVQFPVIFFRVIFHHQTKKINLFLKSCYIHVCLCFFPYWTVFSNRCVISLHQRDQYYIILL